GPVGTCNGNEMKNPMYQAFIDAGVQAGYPYTADYNGYQQEGFGPMHMTVKNGVRASTATAYLYPALKRPNLTLLSHAISKRILFDGTRATGIEYLQRKQTHQVSAAKEVILSAGSIGSPMLLQMSGVGPAAVLQSAGVKVKQDLPGVGENLQDHIEVYFQYESKQAITLNSKLDYFNMGLIGARWILIRSGLGATNHFESCAFIRSQAGVEWPDIEYHFLPAAMRYDGNGAVDGHGFQAHVGPTKSLSRGHVRILSDDPTHKPNILFNYFKHEYDTKNWLACIKLTREIFAQAAMNPYCGRAIQPLDDLQSDRDIVAWVKNNVESAYHPSCTCKIGEDGDAMAVLDPQCRVRGLDSLRVVDSSVFPRITNGNLNAPTMMVAEKAADIISGRRALPKSTVTSWIAKDWQQSQR
ncbi:MAG: choline dehydrogenase, partial [Pseudomonadales bacterium]